MPEHDQYDPPDRVRATTASWANTTVAVLPGADHFLGGALQQVGDELVALIGDVVERTRR